MRRQGHPLPLPGPGGGVSERARGRGAHHVRGGRVQGGPRLGSRARAGEWSRLAGDGCPWYQRESLPIRAGIGQGVDGCGGLAGRTTRDRRRPDRCVRHQPRRLLGDAAGRHLPRTGDGSGCHRRQPLRLPDVTRGGAGVRRYAERAFHVRLRGAGGRADLRADDGRRRRRSCTGSGRSPNSGWPMPSSARC